MAVVSPPDLECSINLGSARRLYGRFVSFNGKRVGKVFDVIGKVDEPGVVVRLFKGGVNPDILIGKLLYLT